MNFIYKTTIRLVALFVLVLCIVLIASESKLSSETGLDVKAAVFVILAPVLVWVLFGKASLNFRSMFNRFFEMQKSPNSKILDDLENMSFQVRGQFGFSQMVKFSEAHPDFTIRYAGELFSAKYQTEEVERLLQRKIYAEDEQWDSLSKAFHFFAKMAPYFGMLATVLGMTSLLQNISDMNQISKSMGLAMQGTLFGVIGFTLIFAPMQKFVSDIRDQALKRNQMIAHWFVSVAKQADPTLLNQELRSFCFELNKSEKKTIATSHPSRSAQP